MSLDFQVVLPQEAIQLNNISRVAGTGTRGVPMALMIQGADFSSVEEVQINSMVSPDVIIVSRQSLIAQVPDALASQTITTVSVLSRRLTLTPKSFLRFKISTSAGRVRGILRLMQLFLKILFTTPGTDIFAPRIGGGVLRNLGATFGADQTGDIVSNLAISVQQTARQIVALQSRDQSIPREERLLSAQLVSAGFNKTESALVGVIQLTNQAGNTALANLEL